MNNVYYSLNTYFENVVDTQIWCDSVLLINFQIHLFHVAMLFKSLLINLGKADQWTISNVIGEKVLDILERVQENHCENYSSSKILGLLIRLSDKNENSSYTK